ncbi:vanadium-dependent haloperoxidase [Psychroserpens sp.]|uniref:vanadium-dependent haloperoxidase n=1 Tax=Psychroserpens sp. TaxID=2020870 RepID=UPI001B1BB725|nr:vanadium-dependent haloperoxidase [Psychroserpens sp.]MBO6606674.1 vanadium-dependent haloperoxidase [Psychroserpens sp.]MBO6653378.1 vanadium-dependent haloperoxidase [Psychroserpens sp.]MBO6680595.1 vanadium-dependent haloperoxidase [Psychroserpens sp.]MBO6750447.1 vanadium-dependent haloperoxidase [Psychroserpens sp.]MBO6914929.1 vanadium-dependent haloperoxidase [Psychroserpens sp.]
MKTSNLKFLLTFLLVLLLFESCNTDDDQINVNTNETVVTDEITQLMVEWNDLWLEIDRYSFGMRPNATSRALAYIHLAAYETAVDDMIDLTSNTSRFQNLIIDNTQRANTIDLNIALNTSYAVAMNHFMFNISSEMASEIDQFKVTKENIFLQNVSNQVLQNSREWGNYVAEQVIAFSQTDVQAESQILEPQPLSYEPPVGEGYWTYSADPERALYPYWESVRTFVISSDMTSSIEPMDYSEDSASDYFSQMNEVYTVNNTAKLEDNEDLWVAEYWSDDVEGLMMSPPGRQISIAKQLIVQNDLNYETSLVLLLKLGFALNDAAVSTWADKYNYMVMRPNVYIQEFIDPDYETNLYRFINWPNPSFPSYPSGHSCFASAAGGVFINTFGNNIDFTERSHEGRTEFRGTPRQFYSISEMVEDAAFSRVPLGVHMRIDCTEGMRLGYEISAAVNDFDLSTN